MMFLKLFKELKFCISYLSRLFNEVVYCFIFVINFYYRKGFYFYCGLGIKVSGEW